MLNYICIADDDEDDRILFEDALRTLSEEPKLVMAENGRELMRMLHGTVPPAPDVIFLDLNMPVKNGYECLTEIRRDQRLRTIPVIIFSTSCEDRYIDLVYELGANYYLCKPSDFARLRQLISKVLHMTLGSGTEQVARQEFLLND